jgi:hypothetical protein
MHLWMRPLSLSLSLSLSLLKIMYWRRRGNGVWGSKTRPWLLGFGGGSGSLKLFSQSHFFLAALSSAKSIRGLDCQITSDDLPHGVQAKARLHWHGSITHEFNCKWALVYMLGKLETIIPRRREDAWKSDIELKCAPCIRKNGGGRPRSGKKVWFSQASSENFLAPPPNCSNAAASLLYKNRRRRRRRRRTHNNNNILFRQESKK